MPNGAECLMIRPGMELIASRFETRRYLALLGGTTEFTKWEGLTFAPNHGAPWCPQAAGPLLVAFCA